MVAGLMTAFCARLLADGQNAAATEWRFVAAFAAALVTTLNAALSAAASPFVRKPVAAPRAILSASIADLTKACGTAIDAHMMRTILETDARETEESLAARRFGVLRRADFAGHM